MTFKGRCFMLKNKEERRRKDPRLHHPEPTALQASWWWTLRTRGGFDINQPSLAIWPWMNEPRELSELWVLSCKVGAWVSVVVRTRCSDQNLASCFLRAWTAFSHFLSPQIPDISAYEAQAPAERQQLWLSEWWQPSFWQRSSWSAWQTVKWL